MVNKNIFLEKSFLVLLFCEGDEFYNVCLWSGMGVWFFRDNSNVDDYLEINFGNVFFICVVVF